MTSFSYSKFKMLSKEIQELQDLSELEQIKVGQQLLEDKEFVLFKWVFVHLKGFKILIYWFKRPIKIHLMFVIYGLT